MSSTRRTAVVAIHGVANQEAGETARAIALCVAEPVGRGVSTTEQWSLRAPSLPRGAERGPLEEELGRGDADELGPRFRSVVLRDVPLTAERSVDLHEVAWADLSRPGRSAASVLGALIGLVLGLPSIGQRERGAAGLPHTLGTRLERASASVRAVMVPALVVGVLLSLSLVALPCSRDRATWIRAVFSLANGLALPPVSAWLFTRRLQPTLDARGAQRRWRHAFVTVLVGTLLGIALQHALPDEALAVLPAIELVVLGAVASGALLRSVLTDARERRVALLCLAVLVVAWLGLVIHNAVGFHRGHAPSDGIAIARNVVYATVFSIELVYVVASAAFAVASLVAIVAVSPWLDAIVRARGSDRTQVHAVRTVATAHALPFVLVLFLALPMVSGVLALLSDNGLLPRTRVRLQVLRSLEHFAREPGVEMQVRHALSSLVRASGTHLLVLALAVTLFVAGVVAFVLTPVVRAELGLAPDGSEAEEASLLEARQRPRDVLARWLERGTYVVADYVRNGALLVAAIILVGFGLEVLAWLAEVVGLDVPLSPRVSDLWDAMAQSSGRLVLAMGGLVGSTALLALPTRLRDLTQPLWPVLDVILDVTRYLDRDRRARILARAHGVLAEVLSEGYDEIVVVAHSQGTLIAADLLRMTARSRREAGAPPIRLVTLGSPLANLYHRLLPGSFAWVRHAIESPDPLGVQSWTNLYGGGDAVGRTVRDTELLRLLRGLSSDPVPGRTDPEDRAHWISETNVGSIGHVHYFRADTGRPDVVREALRAVILGPPTLG